MEKIKENENLIALYEIYHCLLTKTQQEHFEMTYLKDYSIGEIAKLNKISRSAVFDNLNTVREKLINYEESLGIFKKKIAIRELVLKLECEEDLNKQKELLSNLKKII